MNRNELVEQIRTKKSFLCVGLDSDKNKMPASLQHTNNALFEFNKAVIENTKEQSVAYKFNIAFYESQGIAGWEQLEKSLSLIPNNIFTIADAKRGDIGNTSKQYAKTFFETYDFDAITVSPYMGEDSIMPFLEFENKWVIVLALTSNKGSADFQMQKLDNGLYLYEQLLNTATKWGNPNNLMFVVGATHPEYFDIIRKHVPDHFLLIPGVGAQGGSLQEISKHALNQDIGALVNVSRGVIYANQNQNYPNNIKQAALSYQQQMAAYIK